MASYFLVSYGLMEKSGASDGKGKLFYLMNKKRKLAVYGKLRTAPVLLDCLDVALLETQDSELVRFKNIMNKNFI